MHTCNCLEVWISLPLLPECMDVCAFPVAPSGSVLHSLIEAPVFHILGTYQSSSSARVKKVIEPDESRAPIRS